MRNATIILFLLLPMFIGIILLQTFLSRKESKYWGLILPSITFIYSLIMLLSVPFTDGFALVAVLSIFLIGNVPTILFLGIYLACREKKNALAQLDKMKIQDLD